MKYSKLSILAAAVAIVGCSEKEAQQMQPQPPASVTYITVKEEPVKIQSELKGRLAAVEEAEVRPQITGIIQEIKVKDGQEVKKGDILYKVDPSQYQAAYNQAVAAYNTVKADLETARLKAERYSQLAKDKAVPAQEADDANSAYQKLLSLLEERKAAVEIAKINLDYTNIKAPIDGRIGIANITNGALVTANQAASINTITKLDPIYLDITQQSDNFLQMKNLGKQLGATEIPVEIRVGNNEARTGYVSSNELKVDPQTDSIKVRAKFENKDKTLLPGMFAYAKVTYAINENGIKVPLQTVRKNADGKSYVYTIDGNNKVSEVEVEVLQTTGFESIISSGLKDGDKVIFEGVEKVRAGAEVNPTEKKTEVKSQEAIPAK